MPSNITEWLSSRKELKEMKFLTEFPPVKKAVPLRKTTVAVGLGKITIGDTFVDNDENDVLSENEYCRQAEITLRFSIHVPYSKGGVACHEAFADIIDCLSFDSGLNIVSSGCGSISEDRETEAFVLKAEATVKSTLCPADSTDMVFPSFSDKTLLCGSHIRNSEIHVSESRKSFVNQPFYTGSYSGTDKSTRSISLGFEPAFVIVFAGGLPGVINNGTDRRIYCAAAGSISGTLGLEITSNGFRVSNGEGSSFAGSTPFLNESGFSYTYIAARK